MTVFITVIVGVLIFSISQYVLEFVIKPRIRVNNSYMILSQKFLLYQSKITNYNLSQEQVKEIRSASTEILAITYSYWFTFNKKEKKEALSLNQSVNFITHFCLHRENLKEIDFSEEWNNLKKKKKLLIEFRETTFQQQSQESELLHI
ncbi:hypothetical protein QIW31_00420 [Francisellaceae bacterium CB299]|jgi:hypothetical protein